MWSDDKFSRSSDGVGKRRYLIHGAIPTAVTSTADLPNGTDVGFWNVPCLGSRAIIIGWYSVVDDALRASNIPKVLKLYEAVLCLPMHVRCGLSMKQVSLDSITYSEDLFAANSTSSDSFFTFAEKVLTVFPADFLSTNSAAKIVLRAGNLGITFHGNPVNDNIARALQNVAPFVISPEIQMAFRAFEDISQALNDQTKISLLFHAATEAYGKVGQAAVGASVGVLCALRAALVYKDIVKDTHLKKELLTGGRNKVGFVHWFFKRTAFVDFYYNPCQVFKWTVRRRSHKENSSQT